MSGDPEQEYFADGLAEDIITELSRFREFAVIARNSTFFYKGKPLDVSQVARDLGVRYVLEGSVRKIGNRVRVTTQLIDAATNDHLWAERYDREQADIFDLQEEITHTVVASIAPQIDLAEIARSRRDTTSLHAWQLAMRAAGLLLEAINGGNAALMQQAIAAGQEAITADAASLAAHFTLFGAHWACHLYRWGDRPDGALDRAWAVVERMTAINSQDERTLTARGSDRVRVANTRWPRRPTTCPRSQSELRNCPHCAGVCRGDHRPGPRGGSARTTRAATEPAGLLDRNRPPSASHGALHTAQLRRGHTLVRIRNSGTHRAPIRRALMIACSAQAGDMARARSEMAVLDSFAPSFIASVFRGQNPVFTRREDMENLLGGLRLAGLSE